MVSIAIVGAAGAMGTRLSNRLREHREYELRFVESGADGIKRLASRGDTPTTAKEALPTADVAIFAVPDNALVGVAQECTPLMRDDSLVMFLDPAAPSSGRLALREDIGYFVTHPAHPPIFNDETNDAARRDYFGSGAAKQSIVSALIQGSETHYIRGEEISRYAFGPILRSHRITLEQMVLLEPALSETVTATCLTVIREATDEVVRRGVPRQAAHDFVLGHINIELAILFEQSEWMLSAGCLKAIENARPVVFRDDWRAVFNAENVSKSVTAILDQ